MKRFNNRWLLFFLVGASIDVSHAKANLLDDLFDDEEVLESSLLNYNSPGFDAHALCSDYSDVNGEQAEDNKTEPEESELPSASSPCSLLDLLLFDTAATDTSILFPDKNVKMYRGQFDLMKINYIDNTVCDKHMPADIKAQCPIDQNILTDDEKAIVEKYYWLTKQKYESPWYMKFINKKIGYGIYAAADIEPGQLIAEYAGILFDAYTYTATPHNSKYCWNINPPQRMPTAQKFYVDAISSCNFTRIINHSYKPNVIPVTMHGPDGSRMLYVACEKIKKDEQLLVNYGEGYWTTRGAPADLSR